MTPTHKTAFSQTLPYNGRRHARSRHRLIFELAGVAFVVLMLGFTDSQHWLAATWTGIGATVAFCLSSYI